jgi:uncharacterized protein
MHRLVRRTLTDVVVLGLLLTSAVRAQDAAPAVTARSTVEIDPLFFSDRGDHAVGSCARVSMDVGGAAPGRMRIGVLESGIEAVGDMWKAATWSAALVAFQTSAFDWRAVQVTADVGEGRIDGPSAGGLMTVGILSSVLGHPLDPSVTMTGTINPDGTIGPVGGIPYKLEGAKAQGKTKVLIPAFSLFEFDSYKQQRVDLIERGRELGIEVIPVNHVRQAYREFTGVSLPRTERAERLPRASTAVNSAFAGRMQRWIDLQKKARDKYQAMGTGVHIDFSERLMQQSQECNDRAGPLLGSGQFPSAFNEMTAAAYQAWAAHEVARYNHAYIHRGRQAMLALMDDTRWLSSEVEKATLALRSFEPQTIDQLSMYLLACNAYFEALCMQQLGDDVKNLLQQAPQVGDQFVILGASYHTWAWLDCLLTADLIEIARSHQGGRPLHDSVLPLALANIYRQCASANFAAVNAATIPDVQKKYGVNEDLAKLALGVVDPYYGAANLGLKQVWSSLPGRIQNEKPSQYALLAASLSLHSRTAMLLGKYYSLGVEHDDDYNIVRVTNEAALTDWLEESEDQARRSIGMLVESGVDATTCAQMYSVGRVQEGRGSVERIQALQSYFSTNVMAQVLAMLASVGPP